MRGTISSAIAINLSPGFVTVAVEKGRLSGRVTARETLSRRLHPRPRASQPKAAAGRSGGRLE